MDWIYMKQLSINANKTKKGGQIIQVECQFQYTIILAQNTWQWIYVPGDFMIWRDKEDQMTTKAGYNYIITKFRQFTSYTCESNWL